MPFGDSANATESAARGRKKGGEATKAAAKKTYLLPSQTFDWKKARRLHRQTMIEIYGPPETWEYDNNEETA